MRWLTIIAALGCHPTPVPTPPATQLIFCPMNASPTSDEVCPSMFTVDGRPCVRCAIQAGCVDPGTGAYCTTGPCIADPACSVQGTIPPFVTP
jgi:hypothetical protein